MSTGFKNLENLTRQQMFDSVTLTSIPGDGSAGPLIYTIDITFFNLPPSDPTIALQLFPSGAFASGTDSDGAIGVLKSFTNLGNDIDYGLSGGGTISFPNGVWQSAVRGVLNYDGGLCNISISFLITNPILTYDPSLTDPTHTPTTNNKTWDGHKGTIDITTQYNNSDNEDPIAIAFYRDDLPIASIPWVDGITDYTYTDTVFDPGTVTYKTVVYKYSPNKVSIPTTPIVVEFGGPPTFDIVGSGGFNLGGNALIAFLVNPSGIYKLVVGKTHDTVYIDVSQGNDTTDVAIPNPFIETFFMGK